MSAAMVDQGQKNKKKHWLKRPKATPQKRNLDQIQMIQNLIFDSNSFFGNIFSGVQLQSTRSSGHHQSFFIPEFIAENPKANKNQPKRSLILQYGFAQKTSLILRMSTLLKLEITCSQNTTKQLSQLTNFPANMFQFGVRKIICTAPFPDAQELLS